MTTFAVLPPTVRSFIGDFVARRRRVRLVRAAGIALGMLLFWMVGWCMVDRLVPMAGWLRLLVLAVGVVAVAVLLMRPLRDALARRVDWVTAAGEIESRHPAFAERLQTVTSRLLGPTGQRGSVEMIHHLLDEVQAQVRPDLPERLMPWSHAARGWAPVAAMLLVMAVLSLITWVDLPRLMLRFVAPLAPVAPASTTRIEADHSPQQVIQGEPVMFRASAQRLGNDGLRLHLSTDGRNWSTRAMPPAGDGFAYVMPAAERDFSYMVSGGDARTLPRSVRVLRRPAVVAFNIRYTYPAYTQRPPLTVTNTDGTLEAPVGTEATIAIVASEPLADATLLIDGQEVPTQSTVEPVVRQAKLRIERDQSWELHMTSTSGARGNGPGPMTLRALPDRAPMVRLLQPSADLRLTPRDVVGLHYLAMDDFGLESLKVIASINGADHQQSAITLRGEARRQEGRIDLDLATLPVDIGDIVRIRFEAADRGGQTAASDPRHILISPRSIDMNTYLRLAELRQAQSLADTLLAELKAAHDAYRRIPAEQRRYAAGWMITGEFDQHLVSAGEAGVLLRQTLLRVMTRSTSAELSTGLANLVDNAQLAASLAEHTMGRAPLADSAVIDALLDRAREKAQKLTERVAVVSQGEYAAAIAADRANIAALAQRDGKSLDDAARRSLERAREDVAAGARALKLNPDAADLDQQLQAKVAAMQRLAGELPVIDFAEVSRPWSRRPEDVRMPIALPPRLSAAAQAEAVRPDADLLRARDLQLGSQAAEALAQRVVVISDTDVRRPEVLEQYPAALAALQREHQLNRRSQDVLDPQEVQRIATEAESARAKLREWAGIEPPTQVAQADTLSAMEASALHQQKQYEAAARLDEAAAQANAVPANAAPADAANADQQARTPLPNDMPSAAAPSAMTADANDPSNLDPDGRHAAEADRRRALAQAMQTSKRLDEIAAAQRQIAQETAQRQADDASDLSRQQAQVAQALDQVHKQVQDPLDLLSDDTQPDTRSAAMAAIAEAQQQLAAMPQQLADAQAAAADHRQAQAAAERADQEAAGAREADREPAGRVAEQARKAAEAAAERQAEAAAAVSPDVAEAMARALGPYVPETAAAAEAIENKLGSALRSLQQAMDGGDGPGTERAAGEARQAIRAVQEDLRDAQMQLAEQDPLVAAEWFAREAAAALAAEPPDFEAAMRSQSMVNSALSRAWQASVRQGAQLRWAGSGAMRSLYQLDVLLPLSGGGGAGLAIDTAEAPGPREWGRARRRDEADRTATGRQADPPGYQEALRAYFEALGQSGKEEQKQ